MSQPYAMRVRRWERAVEELAMEMCYETNRDGIPLALNVDPFIREFNVCLSHINACKQDESATYQLASAHITINNPTCSRRLMNECTCAYKGGHAYCPACNDGEDMSDGVAK